MIPFPDTFSRDGFKCRVLKREGRVVLVQVGGIEHYEVAVLQLVKDKTIQGKLYPAHEAMPSNSQWGYSGWSFMRRDLAEAEFSKLAEKWAKQSRVA